MDGARALHPPPSHAFHAFRCWLKPMQGQQRKEGVEVGRGTRRWRGARTSHPGNHFSRHDGTERNHLMSSSGCGGKLGLAGETGSARPTPSLHPPHTPHFTLTQPLVRVKWSVWRALTPTTTLSCRPLPGITLHGPDSRNLWDGMSGGWGARAHLHATFLTST